MASKVLFFGMVVYALYFSAKNFLSHKHNQVVNTHRQNALMTFQVLVDAAKNNAVVPPATDSAKTLVKETPKKEDAPKKDKKELL